MENLWALVSGVFSDLRSPEIRTIYYGTENHPYFCYQLLEGAEISISSQNWRQFWAVSAASRNWDLLEFCVLLVPGMIRLRTPSAATLASPTPNQHTYVELHLRPTARLRWLLHHMEAIAAAAAAAAAVAAAARCRSCCCWQQQQQQQQQQRHSGGGSSSNGSSDGDSTSPAILLPYLPKTRSLAAAVGFAFPLTTQTRRPLNTT